MRNQSLHANRHVAATRHTRGDGLLLALQRVNRLKQAVGLAVGRLLAEALRPLMPVRFTRLAVVAGGGFGAGPLEMLEGRELFSAGSVTFSGGTLTVTGSPSVGCSLSVQPATNTTLTGNAGSGHELTVKTSSVKAIVINGGTGADTIYVDGSLDVPVTIKGGGGNDNVRGGGGLNTILLGNGNAWVSARGTAAYVNAGDGNVTLLGGSGNDTLVAGNGNDYVDGAGGNDSVSVGNGNDKIYGDSGNDTVVVGNGNDLIYGGLGNDKITTGTGKDTVYSGAGNDTVITGSSQTIIADRSSTDKVTSAGGSSSTSPTATPSENVSDPLDPKWVTYSASAAASGGPRAVLQVLDPAAMVGSGVVVRGLNSVVGAGSDIDANFVWNFGDAGGAHDDLSGFNASHVYDQAGTYTISLTVTNINGKSSTATARVTIAADSRNVVYVNSSTGNDADSGATPGAAVKTAARAATLIDNGTEILFARGQTFAVTSAIQLKYSNVVVGAYGSGADPILNYTTGDSDSAIFTTNGNNAVAVTIQNLSLVTKLGTAMASAGNLANGINVGGYDTVIRDCTFNSLAYDVNAVGSPVGLSVFDDSSPAKSGVYGYFVWCTDATDLSIVGNYADGSEHEHVVRTTGTNEEMLADNNFTTYDGKGCIEMHAGSYVWVSNNTVTYGDIRVGPRGGDTEPASTVTAYCVIQDNTLHDTDVEVDPGSYHVMIRNNVIDRNDGQDCIAVTGQDSAGRQSTDVRVFNNTGYESSSQGQFIEVYGYVNGVQLANNLYVAPDMSVGSQGTAPVYIDATSTAGWTLITDNVWQTPAHTTLWADGGINFMDNGYVQAGERTAAEWNAMSVVGTDVFAGVSLNTSTWKPSSGSAAATTGRAVAGVYGDFYGNGRPSSGTWTAGAVQL